MPSKNKAPKVAKTKASKKSKIVDTVLVKDEQVVAPVADSVADSVADPVVSVESVAEPVVEEFDYSVELDHLQGELKNALSLLKNLVTHVTKLEKRINRDRKIVLKKIKSKPRKISTSLNGFSKPGPISPELRKFLELEDELIARTEVTKRITSYCQKHKLQKESDKRIILPDKVLSKLLNVPKGEVLTYFNLQKYMKVHFPNKDGVYPTL